MHNMIMQISAIIFPPIEHYCNFLKNILDVPATPSIQKQIHQKHALTPESKQAAESKPKGFAGKFSSSTV